MPTLTQRIDARSSTHDAGSSTPDARRIAKAGSDARGTSTEEPDARRRPEGSEVSNQDWYYGG